MKLDPLGVKRAAQIGAAVFGFVAEPFRRLRQRRIRKRRWKELGLPEEESMAIDLGTRTSTNAGVAGLAVVWLCQLVEQFLPGLLGANADDYLIVAAAWLVARFSKTPELPKVL